MPLGRILLVRKGAEYCAIKFTDNWLGESEKDRFTSYEYFFQGDGSGDFTRNNALSGVGELHMPEFKTIFFDVGYFKTTPITRILCGDMELRWSDIAWVYLDELELAPTPWRSIEEVNIIDPRVQWFKKDRKRETQSLPIDTLWNKMDKNSPLNKGD